MTNAFDINAGAECEAARKDHAAQIIALLELQTNGNWPECLELARAELDRTGSALWLAVCDGLRLLIRQEAVFRSARPPEVPADDDSVPY